MIDFLANVIKFEMETAPLRRIIDIFRHAHAGTSYRGLCQPLVQSRSFKKITLNLYEATCRLERKRSVSKREIKKYASTISFLFFFPLWEKTF